jgi:hypothetical protein
MISLSDGVTTVYLPADMLWENEHNWDNVVTEANYSLTGSLIIEVSEKKAGRPITLKSRTNMHWIWHDDLVQLRTWSDSPGQQLTLNLRGVNYTVMFDHRTLSIEAEMLGYWKTPTSQTRYRVTLQFFSLT